MPSYSAPALRKSEDSITETSDMPPAAHLRYQHKPFPGSSHTWAMEQCTKLPPTSKVLDVGSGSGAIGKLLRERSFSELYAVEVDDEARRNTAATYRRMETSLDAYHGESFDLILILDVLEHLPNAETIFRQAASLLKPGGTMLVSVPNIAHWSARFALLFGIFKYTDRGILDRTHVRFFTRQTFAAFLKLVPSIEVSRLDASISPMEFVLPGWACRNPLFTLFSRIRMTAAALFPGLLAYQHLALLKRRT